MNQILVNKIKLMNQILVIKNNKIIMLISNKKISLLIKVFCIIIMIINKSKINKKLMSKYKMNQKIILQ